MGVRWVVTGFLLASALMLAAAAPCFAGPANPLPAADAAQAGAAAGSLCEPSTLGSPYVPVDSWVYPAMYRLYSLGYVDHLFLNMRPWTRVSMENMLDDAAAKIEDADPSSARDQAQEIYDALARELEPDMSGPCLENKGQVRLESTYTVARGMTGTPLRDSFHLGSTVVNDYGRPYENGFNSYSGLSGYATAGPFTLYARAEFDAAPSGPGYSTTLAQELSAIDGTVYTDPVTHLTNYYLPQTTIPMGPLSAVTHGRLMEAYVSAKLLNHEISFGKVDQWLGPAQGASFAYSNNAENIYGFEINRVEPLWVPLLSSLTGPFRYEFLIGPLQGHEYMPNPAYQANPSPNIANVINPGDPWVHLEKISFRPTSNLEFGFERTAIWGGKGHGPITLHSFLKSFFSLTAPGGPGSTGPDQKYGRDDPGARFGAFDFSYRVPYLRKWLTLYTDGEVHDDISPIDAPRRASWRPGLYLSHVPGVPRLDMRVETAWTDPPVSTSNGGRFMYWETIQKQGYTNNGQMFGDWMGREAKGGQAWITYHLSGNEWVSVNARNQKAAKDFLAVGNTQYGSTINDLGVQAVKRIGNDFEINGNFTMEHYKEPIYMPGQQTVTNTNIQLTWYPTRKVSF